MTRVSLIWLTAFCAACTVDFFVGEDAQTTGEVDSETEAAQDPPGEDDAEVEGEDEADEDGESAEATTSGENPEDTEGDAGNEDEEGGEEKGDPDAGEADSGEPGFDCTDLVFDECVEFEQCDWFGEESGICVEDPCLQEPPKGCLELDFETCVESGCSWIGNVETGECDFPECLACSDLEFLDCVRSEDCGWDAKEAVCSAL